MFTKASTGAEWVFVYGTLRRGGVHETRMREGQLLGPALVMGQLHAVSWHPGMVTLPEDRGGSWVKGEIHEVDKELLSRLDGYHGLGADRPGGAGDRDGAGSSGYRRVQTLAYANLPEQPGPQGEPVTVWLWEWTAPLAEASFIPSGDWLEYLHPPSAPWFTWAALFAAIAPYAFAALPDAPGTGFAAMAPGGVLFLLGAISALLLGQFSLLMADRRREIHQRLRKVTQILLLIELSGGVLVLMGASGR